MRSLFSRLPQTIEFRSGELGFHQSVVLFTASAVAAVLLLIFAVTNFVEQHRYIAMANLLLLALLVGNLAWYRISLDIKTSTTIFLAIYLGENILAIVNEYFAYMGLFWAALFPLLAFILKGYRRGLRWSLALGAFLAVFTLLHGLGYFVGAYATTTLLSLLVNYCLMALTAAVLWRWNKQLIVEQSPLSHQAVLKNQDTLTGLLSRAAFQDELTASLESGGGQNKERVLLCLGLDGIKAVEYRYGRSTRDAVLTMVAKRIKASVRESDLIGRYEDEVFFVALRSVQGADVNRLVEKVLEKVAAPYWQGSDCFDLAVGYGVSLYPEEGGSILGLLVKAQRQMRSMLLEKKVLAVGLEL